MKAFANEILFDDAKRSPLPHGTVHCGRTMTTSPENRQSPNTPITPDLVIQSSPDFGVVGEIKWGMHRDRARYNKQVQDTADQLEKYDDDLTGWPLHPTGDGKVANHDLALLVNHEDSKKVAREISGRLNNGGLRLYRRFAIIGFGQFSRADGIWPELDLEFGSLTDPKKTTKLQDRLLIRPEKLDASPSVGLVQLSDLEPPAPVMMELVHKAIVQNLSRDEHEAHRLDGEVAKRVRLDDVCEWVSRFSFNRRDGRDGECPARPWVTSAMQKFVGMKWAEAVDGTPDKWVFLHKKGRTQEGSKEALQPLHRILREEVGAGRRSGQKGTGAEREEASQGKGEGTGRGRAKEAAE